MLLTYIDCGSLLRAAGAVGGSLPPSALCLAFFLLIVLGITKLFFLTKIDSASSCAGKDKGEGMSKSILSCVKVLFASFFDTVHGLGMSALVGVALP